MKYLGVIAILVTSLSTARAQTVGSFMGDGNDILELCTDDTGFKGCVAYLAGVADAMVGGNPVAGYRACIPSKGVTIGQVLSVTVSYLTWPEHILSRQRASGSEPAPSPLVRVSDLREKASLRRT
jgi:hypothetical protein